jgi:hypothetical protein
MSQRIADRVPRKGFVEEMAPQLLPPKRNSPSNLSGGGQLEGAVYAVD